MSFEIAVSDNFKIEAKRLIKKFPSLKKDLEVLSSELAANPKAGVSLGNNVFKVRLRITSKNKGKSAGARVITFVRENYNRVVLLSIFDKGDRSTISSQRIKELLQGYLE
jgi:hypothetical protein